MRKKIAVLLLCLSMYMPAFASTKNEKIVNEKYSAASITLFIMTGVGVVLSCLDYYLYR
jgi:hypothetical protein